MSINNALPIYYVFKDLNKLPEPLNIYEMLKLVKDKKLTKETYVWRIDLNNWVQAGNVPDLKPIFAIPPLPEDTPELKKKIAADLEEENLNSSWIRKSNKHHFRAVIKTTPPYRSTTTMKKLLPFFLAIFLTSFANAAEPREEGTITATVRWYNNKPWTGGRGKFEYGIPLSYGEAIYEIDFIDPNFIPEQINRFLEENTPRRPVHHSNV